MAEEEMGSKKEKNNEEATVSKGFKRKRGGVEG